MLNVRPFANVPLPDARTHGAPLSVPLAEMDPPFTQFTVVVNAPFESTVIVPMPTHSPLGISDVLAAAVVVPIAAKAVTHAGRDDDSDLHGSSG